MVRCGFTVRAGVVLATVLALLSPGAARAEAPSPPTAAPPPLTDDRGRTLTLRGWNVEDKTHRGADALSAITERHFRDLHDQGFNFARLLVFWDDLEPRRGHYSGRYLRSIERILDWAHRWRVQVVIDAHQDVFGPEFGHRGIPEWATRTDGLPFTPHPEDWFAEYFEPAVQAAFEHLYEDRDLQRAQARMWQVLARRLGHHPAVLGYDLINEPMGRLRPGEDLPAAAHRIESEQLTPMYNRIADAIRTVDRHSRLFVEPTPIVGEGLPTGLGRVEDPKVVYAPHFYNATMEAGGDYDPSARWLEDYESAVTGYPAAQRIPVVVGEWGPRDSSLPRMGRFYDDALASLDRYSSGWAGYVWCYGGGYCAMDEDGRFLPNKERTARPFAPAVAGSVRRQHFDPTTDTFRLVYTPSGRSGVSELSTPATAAGWQVTVRGPAKARPSTVPPGERGTVQVMTRPGASGEVTVTVSARKRGEFSEGTDTPRRRVTTTGGTDGNTARRVAQTEVPFSSMGGI
ncbi:cellulase family glycosylhydrolase [Streptomyces sp. HD1123-B1]|uniref:cellulase family glycosylhydrolase n=1 Tax=Streptomyces huangiella TaxID=3228804 RepID=UPI003D7EDABA